MLELLTELDSVASLTPSISLMRWSICATDVWLVAQPVRVAEGRLPAGVAELTVELELELLELLELELPEEVFLASAVTKTVPVSPEREICGGSTRPSSWSVWAQSKRVSMSVSAAVVRASLSLIRPL